MRILFLTHSFNSLTQRLFVELTQLGHLVTIEFDINDRVTQEAVDMAKPDVIVAPFLKRAIPEAVWSRYVCLVVHPGIEGDRGPSALDWAIQQGFTQWGVTVLQANGEMDGGPVWETRKFDLPQQSKSSIYRNLVTPAAVEAVLACLKRFPLADARPKVPGQFKPMMRQADRVIDWDGDDSAAVLRKIRAADGMPGVLDQLFGVPVYLHDSHPAPGLQGPAGQVVARSGHALARATRDGAVWIGHVRRRDDEPTIKLPAALALADVLPDLPQAQGYDDIRYEEAGAVGYLHFDFYNGAMSTEQCQRLLAAYQQAASRPTKVIVLMGGREYWSNGIHLNVIEAAPSPADESWRNINAMNDLTRAIITDTDHVTVAALQGNAGAGGVFLALAADHVWARQGIILNPHYKGMGNLYGSEYWTYLLPRRIGEAAAARMTAARLPVGTAQALEMGLIDDHFAADRDEFRHLVGHKAAALAAAGDWDLFMSGKRLTRQRDEDVKPLEAYGQAELEKMKLNFFGFDPSYHVARYHFVRKVPKSRTPTFLAVHRHKQD